MAKTRKGSSGLLIGAAVALGAFALFRQGQATATTLQSARLKGFEVKGWNGTTLSALAQVEFNNSDVSRDVQLQELALDMSYNGTTLGTAHLKDGKTLAANQNTTLAVPVTLNIGSLLTQMALTGKVPSLRTFTSVSKVVSWLQENIAPESVRMQGTAKVSGLVVSFDQAVPLGDYFPTAPRPGPVDQLPTRASRPLATNASASAVPRVVQSSVPVATKAAPARKAGRGAALVRQGTAIVQQAAGVVRTIKQARPAAGKVRRPAALPDDLTVLREARNKGNKPRGKRPAVPTGQPLPTPTQPIPYS